MATYTVQYQVTIAVEVEADSEAEAREEAYDVMADMLDNNDSIGWSTDSDDIVVECIADDDDDDDDDDATPEFDPNMPHGRRRLSHEEVMNQLIATFPK